jgi:transcriptional regulator with XRE-family HTH domain
MPVMGLTDVWARNLRAAREAHGLSQQELSLMAGCARTTVSDHERQTKEPGLKTMERLAAALGLEVVDLLRDEDEGDAEAARARFLEGSAHRPAQRGIPSGDEA